MSFYLAEITADFIELALFFVGLYYVAVGVFSFFTRHNISRSDDEFRHGSFAVVIPAHDEESVIAQSVKSVFKADYPKDKIRVFVVADGCSDGTAYEAEKAGAEVIVKNGRAEGKTAALKAAAEHIFSVSRDDEFDYIAVIDADNLVESEFFKEMNYMMSCGYNVLQGRVETKNPNQNWLTAAYSVWYALETRFGRLGAHNLGLGCKISGTGYCVRCDVFRKFPPSGDCLAEDLEYTSRLLLGGIKAGFARGAVVFDEKPSTLSSSLRQRIRWVKGIVDVQGRYGGRFLKNRMLTGFLSLYGDFLGIFTYALFTLISLFATISILYDYDFPLCGFWVNPVSFTALNIYLGIGLLTALIGLAVDRKFNKNTIFNVFGFIIYCVTWIPAAVIGLLSHNRKDWYHTRHNVGTRE